jgi:hypothetical protein
MHMVAARQESAFLCIVSYPHSFGFLKKTGKPAEPTLGKPHPAAAMAAGYGDVRSPPSLLLSETGPRP